MDEIDELDDLLLDSIDQIPIITVSFWSKKYIINCEFNELCY